MCGDSSAQGLLPTDNSSNFYCCHMVAVQLAAQGPHCRNIKGLSHSSAQFQITTLGTRGKLLCWSFSPLMILRLGKT